MHIRFLYYKDCPSHETALQRLREVLEEEGVQASVEVLEVRTESEAQEHSFVGSPTIRIDGRDIAPISEDAVYGLTCRAYYKEDGRISPLPPKDMIRKAIIKLK